TGGACGTVGGFGRLGARRVGPLLGTRRSRRLLRDRRLSRPISFERTTMPPYQWARRGDINAFFGLMLDNVAVMIILFSAVTSALPIEVQAKEGLVRFTPDFVLTRMIPGTALGVLLGDLVYTALAFRLARRTGRQDVTAMPLGLDTPSTFPVAFLVLLPTLHETLAKKTGRHDQSMEFAW